MTQWSFVAQHPINGVGEELDYSNINSLVKNYPHADKKQDNRITIGFFAAAVPLILTCMLSPQALVNLGYNYYLGIFLEKIHPATHLSFIFILIQLFTKRRQKLIKVIKNYPGSIYLGISATLVAIYSGFFLDVPAAGLADTWLLPAMIFLLCAQLNSAERKILNVIFVMFFVVNSLVGVLEIVTNRRIVPIVIVSSISGEYAFPIEWRAGAFLGHPLNNAYLTGVFILISVFDSIRISVIYKFPVLLICGMSMLAFGSRAGSALLVVTLALAIFWQMLRAAITGTIRKDVIGYVFGIVAFLFCGLPIVLASGLADRFILRFFVDHGSAAARTNVLTMFGDLPFSRLITGLPREEMVQMGLRYGIGAGIESFWLNFIISFGIIGCLIFMPSLLLFCIGLIKKTNKSNIIVLLYFFGCCSTSVSLASKSLMLAVVTGLMLAGEQAVFSRRSRGLDSPTGVNITKFINRYG